MPRTRATVVAVTLGLLVTGCGLLGRNAAPNPENRNIDLVVRNQNFYDATLYTLSPGGSRRRLGRVAGNTTETFTFPWSMLELRIEIQLLSVGSTVTNALPIDQGDEVELIITPDLHLRIP